jgi:hypothetical protein
MLEKGGLIKGLRRWYRMSLYTTYATTADLAEYLGIAEGSLPADSTRLLKRASELIKYLCLNNIDSTSADHTEALQLATCAQVEYWISTGESISLMSGVKSISIGSFSVDYGDSKNGSATSQLATRARHYLNDQCLLYRGVKSIANTPDITDNAD